MSIPLDAFHAYTYTTAVWYGTRAFVRIWDPNMVYTWFSNERLWQSPASVELYNLRTDAFGLALLAFYVALLPSLTSQHLTLFSTRPITSSAHSAQLARLLLIGSLLHHAGTAVLAYFQWADSKTSTGAMLLGWAFSSFLVVLGGAGLLGVGEGVKVDVPGSGVLVGDGGKKLRSGKKH